VDTPLLWACGNDDCVYRSDLPDSVVEAMHDIQFRVTLRNMQDHNLDIERAGDKRSWQLIAPAVAYLVS